MGPSPLGFVPGQVTASFTEHQTPSGTAPPLLQFSQSDLNTMAPPTGFSGNYDFTTNTMTSSSQVILFFAGNAPYDANRLYVQAFLWTEADDNIDLNNIKVAASGTAVPEPSKPSYAWKQRVEGHHLCWSQVARVIKVFGWKPYGVTALNGTSTGKDNSVKLTRTGL
jgi:hypothetical protein